MFNQDGLVGSRPLSEVRIAIFEKRVNHQVLIARGESLLPDQTNVVMDGNGPVLCPVGRLSLEFFLHGVHDGQSGAGSSWTLTWMI